MKKKKLKPQPKPKSKATEKPKVKSKKVRANPPQARPQSSATVDLEIVTNEITKQKDDALNGMVSLIQQGVLTLMTQDISKCEELQSVSKRILNRSRNYCDQNEFLLLNALSAYLDLFLGLARSLKFQVEGRFSAARVESEKGITICEQTIASFATVEIGAQTYEQIEPSINAMRTTVLCFAEILKGSVIQIGSEIYGYQGNRQAYLKGLRESVLHYKRAHEIAASSDSDLVLQLRQVCSRMSDSMEARADVFEREFSNKTPYLTPSGNKIFIIHGHDEAKWRELKLLLIEWKLESVVLKEEVNTGRTVIQKFQEFATQCRFAFALLTPDDFVSINNSHGEQTYHQARPNVLFELGWFYGRFGPENICILKKEGTHIFSDLSGVISIDYKNDLQEVKANIAKELKACGVIIPA